MNKYSPFRQNINGEYFMLKNSSKQKSSKLEYKSDYYYLQDYVNPYTCSLGKCEHTKLSNQDKIHRFTNRNNRIR